MAVKSETNLVPKSSGGDWKFATGGDEYQCFSSKQGECEARMEDVNGNTTLGPYQDKIDNLAMTLSILATRMGTSETKADGKPLFVSHFYHENQGELETLQSEWNSHMGKATLLTGLELHWMHTAVVTLDRLGMRNTNWERRSRFGKDYLEWATALHVHEFGITSKKLGDPLSECTATQDPLKNCGLDSGGLLAGVRETCKLLDCSQTVYDYPITREQLNKFLEVIQWSYPYSITEGQSSTQPLEWYSIRNATSTAFDMLAKNRAQKDSSFVSSLIFTYLSLNSFHTHTHTHVRVHTDMMEKPFLFVMIGVLALLCFVHSSHHTRHALVRPSMVWTTSFTASFQTSRMATKMNGHWMSASLLVETLISVVSNNSSSSLEQHVLSPL